MDVNKCLPKWCGFRDGKADLYTEQQFNKKTFAYMALKFDKEFLNFTRELEWKIITINLKRSKNYCTELLLGLLSFCEFFEG